jgi:hypothetical protein
MFSNRLVKLLFVFTMLSILLGIIGTIAPAVIVDAGWGWVFGTAISTIGGIVYGWRADGRISAFAGGAVIGGISIAVGTLLAHTMGTIPIASVIAGTLVGIISGAIAGLVARWVASFPSFARA